jgi:hypothetical protein
MRRRSEHSSQMVISEGLPHILQTWCACSGWRLDRRGTISILCLLAHLSASSIEAATLLRTGNSPLSAPELASSTIRAQARKVDELARNAHSLLASTQKPRPTAISLWVRWSNTTYSPWDRVVSSLMRMFAFARSLTGSNLRKLPAGSFFRISNGKRMDGSHFAWCCKAN